MDNIDKLLKWRRENSTSQKGLADLIGVTQPTMSRLEAGGIVPTLETAIAIERLTAGSVPASGWLEEEGPHAA